MRGVRNEWLHGASPVGCDGGRHKIWWVVQFAALNEPNIHTNTSLRSCMPYCTQNGLALWTCHRA